MIFQIATQVAAARFRELVPFTIAGLIATAVNYGTLHLFLSIIGVATIIAASAAFVLVSGTNFFLQKFWTFGREKPAPASESIASVHRCLAPRAYSQGRRVLDARMFHDIARVGPVFAEIPTTAVVSAVGFLASKYIFTARGALGKLT
jgi:putative flippase GtrA